MKNNLPATKEDLKKAVAKLVTKADAKQFLTKEDVKLFATKEDLKRFATKEDLKRFATKEDLKNGLKNTEQAMRTSIQLDFEDFRQEINEKLNLLPTKEEFFSTMDKVMGELQTIREEHTAGSHQLSDHEDRIVVLEQKAGIVITQC